MTELEKLREFYKIVGKLTLCHDVLDGVAVVYPDKLGAALEKVNPLWYKETA